MTDIQDFERLRLTYRTLKG